MSHQSTRQCVEASKERARRFRGQSSEGLKGKAIIIDISKGAGMGLWKESKMWFKELECGQSRSSTSRTLRKGSLLHFVTC